MCNADILNDDLDDIFGTEPLTVEERQAGELLMAVQPYKMHEEKCKACRGTGTFFSYSGRAVGTCFKCQGKGVLFFRQSLEKREQQATKRAENKADAAQKVLVDRDNWITANREDYVWMTSQRTFEFAIAIVEALNKFGNLTEKQHATVTRLRIANDARNALLNEQTAAREVNAPVVSVEQIEVAFANARQNGIKRPKMKLAGYKFTEAPATGRNVGALYVIRVQDDQYLGKIANGKFIRVRDCSEGEAGEIVAIASNPHESAIAYGQRTGNCAICSRELTNHASIDLGIGPICASKYGW